MSFRDLPLIGVTGPDAGGGFAWVLTRLAIWRAGGRAYRIRPSKFHDVDRLAQHLDGLIIGGGADLDPSLYNEEPMVAQFRRERKRSFPRSLVTFFFSVLVWLLRRLFSSPFSKTEDKPRDVLEKKLLSHALARGLPVLGICRGMQLLNIEFGGSLHQDIATFYVETPQLRTVLPRKKIEIEPGTKLYRLLNTRLTRVNSLHHQSVKVLGKGLCVSAHESNGVIQAIEHSERAFVLGVQWHPEFLPLEKTQQELFRDLVRSAETLKYLRVSPTLQFTARRDRAHEDASPMKEHL